MTDMVSKMAMLIMTLRWSIALHHTHIGTDHYRWPIAELLNMNIIPSEPAKLLLLEVPDNEVHYF